ncbi:hypothetical protein BD769DRAFT_401653 [Suillus cothurnatus]|nr:hypothetical protein BD769DRAFT_401653 [Suillus cothurnatus]
MHLVDFIIEGLITSHPSIRVNCLSFPSLLLRRPVRLVSFIHFWHVRFLFLFPSSICVFSFTGTRQTLDSFRTYLLHVFHSTHFLLNVVTLNLFSPLMVRNGQLDSFSLRTHLCRMRYDLRFFPPCWYKTGIGLFHLRQLSILVQYSFFSFPFPHRSF